MGKKKVTIGPKSNLTDAELERYIEQLKQPLVVKPVKKEKGGVMTTPKVLPKRKPKATATSTNRRTGATRGAGDDKEYMRKAAAATMKGGGEAKRTLELTKENLDAMRAIQNSGERPKPQRPKNLMPTPEQKKKMKNIEFIRDGMRMIPVTKKEDGGAVPKKYKGFSKLPERVQQKIDPDLAGKYKDGGEVRGMGRAYQGKPRGCKIR